MGEQNELSQIYKYYEGEPIVLSNQNLAILIFTLLVLSLLLGWGVLSYSQYNQHVAEAHRETKNVAVSLKEHADQLIDRAEESLSSVAQFVYKSGPISAIDEGGWSQLSEQIGNVSFVHNIQLYDSDGSCIRKILKPSDSCNKIADQDYFIAHVNEEEARFFIGNSHSSENDSEWHIPISISIRTSQGGLQGVVVAWISTTTLNHVYRTIEIGFDGVIALLKKDGWLLAREPAAEEMISQNFSHSPVFEYIKKKPEGTFESLYVHDNSPRISAYSTLIEHDLVILVGRDKDELLAHWKDLIIQQLVALLTIIVIFGVLLLVLVRQTRLKQDAEHRTDEALQLAGDLNAEVEHQDRINKEIQKREERFRAISESVTDWIWEVDENGVYIYSNESVTELLGYHPDEVIGKTPFEFMSAEEGKRVEGIFNEIILKNAAIKALENTHLHKEGHPVIVVTNGVPIYDDEQKLIGYRGADTNITESKRAEVQKVLLQTAKKKDEFLATMSHELRTPLTSIIGHSEELIEDILNLKPQKILERLEIIKAAGENQLTLVNDIMDMSKIESGKFTIDESTYDIEKLLNRIQKILAIKAKEKGIELKVEAHSLVSPLLHGDHNRIEQVLINLVGNAIKFTSHGGEVALTTHADRGRLFVTVKDTGIGMSQEVMDRLFSRFEQGNSSISRQFGGSGLGLYISLNLAEMMGGRIDVSSQEGVGSVFQLILPYQPAESDAKADFVLSSQYYKETRFSGYVLVVEDTPELQLLEKRILERVGVTVTIADNGQEAVDLAQKKPFDLIFMDMQMPVLDGIQACQILRDGGYTQPIIALTANVMQKHHDAFKNAGCNDFLGKPINKAVLVQMLSKYLNK